MELSCFLPPPLLRSAPPRSLARHICVCLHGCAENWVQLTGAAGWRCYAAAACMLLPPCSPLSFQFPPGIRTKDAINEMQLYVNILQVFNRAGLQLGLSSGNSINFHRIYSCLMPCNIKSYCHVASLKVQFPSFQRIGYKMPPREAIGGKMSRDDGRRCQWKLRALRPAFLSELMAFAQDPLRDAEEVGGGDREVICCLGLMKTLEKKQHIKHIFCETGQHSYPGMVDVM